ncbi:MAG: hypothetical protein ACREA0_13450 [bacterium]
MNDKTDRHTALIALALALPEEQHRLRMQRRRRWWMPASPRLR